MRGQKGEPSRRVRRSIGWWAAVVLAIGGVVGLVSAVGRSAPAGACSMAPISMSFDGTVVEIDEERVTYQVDRVRGDHPSDGGRLPEPGGTVVVTYDEPTRLLVLGEAYKVRAWAGDGGEVLSQIAHDVDGDCGTGDGTSALDGSDLGPSSDAVERWWPAALAGLVVVGGAVLVLHALVARHFDRAATT